MLVFTAIFGWYSVQQGVSEHHRHMKVITDLENVVHEFSLQYQGLKYATLEFLIQPDEKYHKNYLKSLAGFKQSFSELEKMQESRADMSFYEHHKQLQADVQRLEAGLKKIVDVRLDAEQTFPFSTIMLSIAEDNIQILSIFDRVVMFTASDGETSAKNALSLFSETRYTWVRLMAEFRLLVSVRFGIFTGDWQEAYKNRVYNIGLYIRKLNDYLQALRVLQADGKLPFEMESDVTEVYDLVNDASYYFQYAVMQLGSPNWRQDLVLLSEDIRPAFAQLDTSIHLLHVKEEQVKSSSMGQVTTIARKLSDALWILLFVGSVLVLLGYFMFSRAILAPIRNVAQALKNEAAGEASMLEEYSSAQEIRSLTDAFDEMRKQVKSRQQRLVNILDNAAEAIITIDEQGNIETFNSAAEQLFGYRSADVLGKKVQMLLPENQFSSYKKLFDDYLSNSHDSYSSALDNANEIEVLSRFGQLIPVSIKVSSTIIDGKILYTALVVNISERIASEQERQQHLTEMAHAGRLSIMGEMAAGIAHELNQPLAAMSLYLQASLRRCDPDADSCKDIVKAVNSSIEQVDRASNIIRKMRGFASRESFEHKRIDLNEVIRRAIEIFLIGQKNISPQPEIVLCSAALYVDIDVLQIEQVLLNLVRNAVDAQADMPEAERMLRVRTELDNKGFARVFVTDAGEGVAKDNIDRIFDTYFTTKSDGLGMGLSISRSIIEEHDGILWYRSVGERGSQFCFVLPLAKI